MTAYIRADEELIKDLKKIGINVPETVDAFLKEVLEEMKEVSKKEEPNNVEKTMGRIQ